MIHSFCLNWLLKWLKLKLNYELSFETASLWPSKEVNLGEHIVNLLSVFIWIVALADYGHLKQMGVIILYFIDVTPFVGNKTIAIRA